MPFRAQDMQPAQRGDIFSQFDIRTPAGHIGRDRDLARLPRLSNDFRFPFMVFGIQNMMFHARAVRCLESSSDFSMEMVPMRTGRLALLSALTSSMTALIFSCSVL